MMGSWQRLQQKVGTARPAADTQLKKLVRYNGGQAGLGTGLTGKTIRPG